MTQCKIVPKVWCQREQVTYFDFDPPIQEDAVGMTVEASSQPTDVLARQRAGGQYLCQLRLGREITRAELAEQVLNVTETYVADVETGRIRLPAEAMSGWALALGVSHERLADSLGRLYDPLPFDPLWTKAAA